MNMNIRILLAAVLSVAFISSAAANDIADTAQERKKKFKLTVITKQELKKQNAGLKCELDSVRAELERYRQELAAADSHAHRSVLDIFLQNSVLLSNEKGRPFCDLPMTYLRYFLFRTA